MINLDVITYGEAMAMFVADDLGHLSEVNHFTKRVAGAELNVATGLARLNFNVAWFSRVGNDSFGQFVLNHLTKEKISHDLVVTDNDHPTGFLIKSKEINGKDPKVEYFRKNSAASFLSINDFSKEHFHNARHLHLTGILAALSESSYQLSLYTSDFMRNLGKTVSFDPNLRPSLWKSTDDMVHKTNQLAFKSNWFLPGIEEGRILTSLNEPEQIADFYLKKGVEIVIIKLGKEGAYFKDKNHHQNIIPAQLVENVIDTVGAGDGFAVGIISALLEKKSIEDAVRRGNYIASLAIQSVGDSDGLPNRQQLGNY
ncbi:sugar kinase [Lonepinella sp. BR2930]|uniref:sugar kinase n=1 Tax=Lonepinella sp. BR2930 TaxID=3434554 RepID=UPI003F6DCB3C